MTLRNVLALYFEIQDEIRKRVDYHKAQNPSFKNLISKLEQLCKEIRKVHSSVTGIDLECFELNREQWLRVFDSVLLNREYDYLSVIKTRKITDEAYRYSFFPTHQSTILQQLLIVWNEPIPSKSAVELLWLLVQSVHFQSSRLADTDFPSIETIFQQSKEST